ncbi:MAG TPA: ABC transporter substrate binding protein, partial [Candidatus Angelobacter sp.]|nr:ABC transporter substrate binding protein [Candidatus Angelobacter sp.]
RSAGAVWLAALIFTASGTLCGVAQDSAGNQEVRPKSVLILYNEGPYIPGNISFQQAFQTKLEELTTNRVDFFEEHLYSRHFSDRAHFVLFQDYLAKKYAHQNLDLIMVFPSGGYSLADGLPEALFPGVPVVFVAGSDMQAPPDLKRPGVTGIIQRCDIRGTLGLIVRLQPETHRVVVVGGNSDGDRATLGFITATAESLEVIEFDFWTNRPVAELPAAAAALRPGTVILLSRFQTDVNGQPFFPSKIAQMLVAKASVPVYVLGGSVVGSGVLGGVVVDAGQLATRGGELAFQVLGGVPPESLPIEIETTGTAMVDWRALRRWKISERSLPAHCVVRYRPVTLWEEHQNLFLVCFGVFLAQAFTIVGLLTQRSLRHRAEAEMLRQRMELAHVTRVSTMGQLAASLAHELTQPLGAILRNTEAAEMFLQKEKPDLAEIRSILEDIRKDDQRAGNVIHRMRSLLKRRPVELKPLELVELIRDSLVLIKSDARARLVKINLETPEKLPAVRGDRVHIQQVLLILILNAMDAMATVAVEERTLTLKTQILNKKFVQVAVIDAGAGIPADRQPRLFEPFFTTKPDGMGMGLAIAQTIIEAHDGSIQGANNTGRGAIFQFTLAVDESSP